MKFRRFGIMLGAVAFAFLAAGCATTYKARTGMVYGGDLMPGHPTPDFAFVAEGGQLTTFSRIRGGVTLLVFPETADHPGSGNYGQLVDLAARHQRWDTPVVVVSVHNVGQKGSCAATGLHEAPVEGEAQLVALCDHDDRVRSLFGPNASGKFFIVGPDGLIAASGSLDDGMQAMEASVRNTVRDRERELAHTRMAEAG